MVKKFRLFQEIRKIIGHLGIVRDLLIGIVTFNRFTIPNLPVFRGIRRDR